MSQRCFPATFSQQRLWFLDQLQPGNPSYLVPFALRLKGALDAGALERALNEVVRRHEILRTCFSFSQGELMQVVADSLRVSLPLVDLSGHPNPEQEARRLASDEARRVLDLGAGPLLRAQLLRLAAGEHVLLLTLHHIIFDGWSRSILINELASLYNAFRRGAPSPLVEPSFQYADYAADQRRYMEGRKFARQLAYWKQKLADPPVLKLPTDRPRPAVQTFSGATTGFRLSQSVLEGINVLCRRYRASAFMILVAAFQSLISRYTGQEDILVGTPVAGRNRRELENLIGFFTNTLVLRLDLTGNPTFETLIERARKTSLDAYEHQEMPFERLVHELSPERNLSQNPLFQVLFSLQNAERPPFQLPGLALEPFPSANATSKFDLSMFLTQKAGAISGRLEYNTDLFHPSTIERFVEHFQLLLESAVGNPALRLSELPLLSPGERHQVLVEWNDTARQYPRHLALHQWFEQQAARTPGAPAVIFGDARLTYEELDRRANRLAGYLRDCGVGRETLTAICLERSEDMVVAALGVLKAGGAYVPLDPAFPRERLGYILEDSGAPVLVTQRTLLADLPPFSGKIACLDADWPEIEAHSGEREPADVAPEQLAYVLYTSGSTGRPKGVEITHGNVVNFLASMREAPGIAAGDTLLAVTTMSFDIAGLELYLPLVSGAKVVVASREEASDGKKLMRLLERSGATILQATPATWWMLLEAGWEGNAGLKVLCGGEALPAELAQRLIPRCRELWNLYGPTETTIWSSVCRVDGTHTGPIPIGRPIANTTMYVLDAQMQPVPVGCAGELYIGGAGVGRGYWNRPELTAEKFLTDPFRPAERVYRTGDMAKHLADGSIQYLGRTDFQVKLRGFRVELGEIETILGQHPGVKECVVVTREDTPGDTRLAAYFIAEPDRNPPVSELRAWVKERLPEYMVPAAVVQLERFPLTPNGKVDRKNLPAPDYRRDGGTPEIAAPRSPIEELIAALWEQLLRVDRVGIEDNFFELGGHSLLGTQVISRIRESLGVELPLRALFEAPTVAGLAKRIEALQREERGIEVPPLRRAGREGPLPLSFAQERLWFLDQLEPDTPVYNVPLTIRLRGSLRIDLLEESLHEVVRRHEILRMRFEAVNGEPRQVIEPHVRHTLTVIDAAGEEEARRLLQEEARQPFNLRTGPLLRPVLVRLGEDDHVLRLSLHHIISDAWTARVLWRDIVTIYQSFLEGKPSPLAEPALQYVDYAVWQRELLSGERLERQLSFWVRQLEGAPPLLELPTDRPRPPIETFRGGLIDKVLGSDLLEKLRGLSRQEGVTLYMTLLAAFNVLLFRYTGQEDLVVGSPIAGRNHAGIEELAGLFVNTIALRTSVAGNPTFAELLGRVRQTAMDAYANQDLPFERLVTELRVERHLSYNPVFQVMMTLQNVPLRYDSIAGVTSSAFPSGSQISKFDLTLFASEVPGGLRIAMEYKSDLFDEPTIERMLGHYGVLLEGIVDQPGDRISELPILTASERQQILVDWNDTRRDYPQLSIPELVEQQADRSPEATAVVCGEERVSYRELDVRANQVAHYLRQRGAGPGVLVGLCCERTTELLVGMLGILKAGSACVPLDPNYPLQRLQYILEDAQMPLMLTEKRLAARIPEDSGQRLYLDEDGPEIARESRERLAPAAGPGDLAYVIFTSGSTGRPKGVALRHGGLVNCLLYLRQQTSLSPGDVVLAHMTISFDFGMTEIFLPLVSGASVSVVGRDVAANGLQLARTIDNSGATLMMATPAAWRLLLDAGWTPSPNLKIVSGGDTLVPSVAARLLAGAGLWNIYGPTETTICATVCRVCDADRAPILGRPVANARLYVLDAQRQPVPVGVPGDLYIGGDGVSLGYVSRDDLTAERFVPDPFAVDPGARLYRTGDLVRYLQDGSLEFIGRLDNQVKLRGYRIELGEVESVLGSHPGVQQAVVLAREDTPGDKRLVGYVVPNPGNSVTSSDLRAFLKRSLPEYMVPGAFVTLDAMPLTPNGKIDRKALPMADPEQAGRERIFLAPRDPTETQLRSIWEETLGVRPIGVRDNFFDLGGHSLLAVSLFGQIEKTFGKNLPLTALFQAQTIEQLAAVLREQGGAAHWSSLVPIQPEGSRPPLFCVHAQSGNVLFYRDLALQLGPDQPLYGLQSVGLDGSRAPLTRVEDMAAHYIKEIRSVQPSAPYLLGGFCLGAYVAFEMARQLQMQKQEVALLAVFHTDGAWRQGGAMDYHRRRVSGLGVLQKLDYLRRRARFRAARIGHSAAEALVRLHLRWRAFLPGRVRNFHVFEQNFRAGRIYVAGPYDGSVTYFQCEGGFNQDPYPYWGGVARRGLEIIKVPGGRTAIFREPHVQTLAQALNARIGKALQAETGQPNTGHGESVGSKRAGDRGI